MTPGASPEYEAQARRARPVDGRLSRRRTHETAPEVALRSELSRRGHVFEVHQRPLAEVRREADIVFPRSRIAVFVDGCFWHGCPIHAVEPKRNDSFWRDTISRNRARDAETDMLLRDAGWISVRVWEHEATDEAADRIDGALSRA